MNLNVLCYPEKQILDKTDPKMKEFKYQIDNIMFEIELEDKVKKYLEQENIDYVPNTISYGGMKKDYEFLDGEKMTLHIVFFQHGKNKNIAITSSILINDKTKCLEYFLNKYTMRKL